MLLGTIPSRDIVYLKNGSYLRGSVVELVPSQSLKIKLENGVILTEIGINTAPPFHQSSGQTVPAILRVRGFSHSS
ncbi:MAG: hypothetical protein V1733_06065 [bacterium]